MNTRRVLWALGAVLLLVAAAVFALQLFAAAALGGLLSVFGMDPPTTEAVGTFLLWLAGLVLLPLAGAGFCLYEALKADSPTAP